MPPKVKQFVNRCANSLGIIERPKVVPEILRFLGVKGEIGVAIFVIGRYQLSDWSGIDKLGPVNLTRFLPFIQGENSKVGRFDFKISPKVDPINDR